MRTNAHPISRILAFIIDYLLIYNTAFLILHFLIGIEAWNALRLSHIISVFYNVLFVLYYNGQTIGKKISKLHVVQEGLPQPKFMNIIVREVAKILYIIPYFGIAVLVANIVLLVMRKKLLHDYLSETQLIYQIETKTNDA